MSVYYPTRTYERRRPPNVIFLPPPPPQAFSRTTTDVPATSESAAAIVTHVLARTATDAPTSGESAVAWVARQRTAIDGPATSEAASQAASHPRSAVDSLATAESAAAIKVQNLARTAQDAPGTAEAAARQLFTSRTASDAVASSESAAGAVGARPPIVRTASEFLGITEIPNAYEAIIRTQAVSANSTSVAISTPAAGDMILLFAFNANSATIPSLPGGYTNLATLGANLCGSRLCYKRATGAESLAGSATNATQVVCIIYRNATRFGLTPVVFSGSSTQLFYSIGNITPFIDPSGASWQASFGAAKAATTGMDGTIATLVNQTFVTTANGLDSNGVVVSPTGGLLTVTGSGTYHTVSAEVMVPQVEICTTTDALTISESATAVVDVNTKGRRPLDAIRTSDVATCALSANKTASESLATSERMARCTGTPIVRTQAVGAAANTATLASTAAGDLILVFAWRNTSTTPPTLPAGYTVLLTDIGPTASYRCGYKVSAGGETTSGVWSNASQVIALVYRNTTGIRYGQSDGGTTPPVLYDAASLIHNDGSSWVTAFAGGRNTTAGIGGRTDVLFNQAVAGTVANGLDSNAGRPAFDDFQRLVTTNTTEWLSLTIELLRASVFLNSVAYDFPATSESAAAVVSGAGAKTGTAVDAVSMAEAAARALSSPRTTADAISTSEAATATKFSLVTRTATDALATAEVASRAVNVPRMAVDALATSEAASRSVGQAKAATEALATAEAASRTSTKPRSATDNLATVEVAIATKFAFIVRTATDSLATAENAARASAKPRTTTDSLATIESAVRAEGEPRQATDSLAISMTAVATKFSFVVRTTTESLAISEVAGRTSAKPRTTAESLATAEAAASTSARLRTAFDSLATSENATRFAARLRAATDALSVAMVATASAVHGELWQFYAGQAAQSALRASLASGALKASEADSLLAAVPLRAASLLVATPAVTASAARITLASSGLRVEKTE